MKYLICVAMILMPLRVALGDGYTVHPGDDVAAVVNRIPGDSAITLRPAPTRWPRIRMGQRQRFGLVENTSGTGRLSRCREALPRMTNSS